MTEQAATRDRILAAATAEFAENGFAGARIDRIAGAAAANKERIYAYFGDKQALFHEVMSSVADHSSTWLPQSGHELPRAAGDLFDAAFENPDLIRLLAWRRLESSGTGDDREETDTIGRKIENIRAAQAEGTIDSRWDPADVLAMAASLAAAWANAPATLTRLAEAEGRPVRERRDVIEEAMRRILQPATPGDEPG